jgi:hypothetical protein
MYSTIQKRSPLKRHTPLRRYTPLKRSTKAIKRSMKPIKNRSSAGIRRRKEWHQAIREKFNNACQGCGRWFPDEMLCGHHVESRGSRPDLELDPENGVALCFECHAAVHGGRLEVQPI